MQHERLSTRSQPPTNGTRSVQELEPEKAVESGLSGLAASGGLAVSESLGPEQVGQA